MGMDRDAPVIMARALRRVPGMLDALVLRLDARVPPEFGGGRGSWSSA